MHPVFQEIIEIATTSALRESRSADKLKEALSQEANSEEWDPNTMEQEVDQFTHQLGQECLQTWAEVKTGEARDQARFCPCGQKRQIYKLKPFWWLTIFGQVRTDVPQLRCPKCHGRDRPFQRLTGLRCRDKSLALQRVLTDFGAEKSFAGASSQLKEHYGVELHPSSIRQVVIRPAQRAEELVTKEHREAITSYQREQRRRDGKPWLIVQSDGSMVRTGKLGLDPAGGLSPKRQRPKRRRQTQWKEVRLSTVQVSGEEKKGYAAVLGSPPKGRGADVCPSITLGLWR